MSKYGFLQVLDEELEKNFPYDYEINWDKKNHAVEVSFLLEVQNAAGVETIDDEGNATSEDILFEEVVLFYNPQKSSFDEGDYLTTIAYEPKKGLSREFLAYFVEALSLTAEQGLDALMDFLADENASDFELVWDTAGFEKGRESLQEGVSFPYPRY